MTAVFPTPERPVIIHPYAIFYSWERPSCWVTEVAQRLKLHDKLPSFPKGWFDDEELKRKFNVGIFTLCRVHILKWIKLRLTEIREEVRKRWNSVAEVGQQIQRVNHSLQQLFEAEKREKKMRIRAAAAEAMHRKKFPPEPQKEERFYSIFDRSNPAYDSDPCDI